MSFAERFSLTFSGLPVTAYYQGNHHRQLLGEGEHQTYWHWVKDTQGTHKALHNKVNVTQFDEFFSILFSFFSYLFFSFDLTQVDGGGPDQAKIHLINFETRLRAPVQSFNISLQCTSLHCSTLHDTTLAPYHTRLHNFTIQNSAQTFNIIVCGEKHAGNGPILAFSLIAQISQ